MNNLKNFPLHFISQLVVRQDIHFIFKKVSGKVTKIKQSKEPQVARYAICHVCIDNLLHVCTYSLKCLDVYCCVTCIREYSLASLCCTQILCTSLLQISNDFLVASWWYINLAKII